MIPNTLPMQQKYIWIEKHTLQQDLDIIEAVWDQLEQKIAIQRALKTTERNDRKLPHRF